MSRKWRHATRARVQQTCRVIVCCICAFMTEGKILCAPMCRFLDDMRAVVLIPCVPHTPYFLSTSCCFRRLCRHTCARPPRPSCHHQGSLRNALTSRTAALAQRTLKRQRDAQALRTTSSLHFESSDVGRHHEGSRRYLQGAD